jgi:hypothetical protein
MYFQIDHTRLLADYCQEGCLAGMAIRFLHRFPEIVDVEIRQILLLH